MQMWFWISYVTLECWRRWRSVEQAFLYGEPSKTSSAGEIHRQETSQNHWQPIKIQLEAQHLFQMHVFDLWTFSERLCKVNVLEIIMNNTRDVFLNLSIHCSLPVHWVRWNVCMCVQAVPTSCADTQWSWGTKTTRRTRGRNVQICLRSMTSQRKSGSWERLRCGCMTNTRSHTWFKVPV